jgi:hypothetical protein
MAGSIPAVSRRLRVANPLVAVAMLRPELDTDSSRRERQNQRKPV